MHPDDEALFVAEMLRDPEILLIDGPRWKTESPASQRNIEGIGNYCVVWSPEDFPTLTAKYIPTCNDWYCNSEFATIQFLRSTLDSDSVLTQGRIAIGTGDEESAKRVESRYKALRTFLKGHYVNSIVRWRNTNRPSAPASSSRSANPSRPDRTLWVGPSALKWLKSKEGRSIKQSPNAFVEGNLAD
jgi:hypothetical protein